MKCANCVADAAYYVDSPVANPVAYCEACLPAHLSARAAAGDFPLPEPKSTKK